ncbi:MAG: D-alanyl-D-alanine carboxypeptidase [Solobacterium sp.]|mgnify:FL=1|nr:D-alanyl-D-alanine carboxypeptidase [Solobacterium sp.]
MKKLRTFLFAITCTLVIALTTLLPVIATDDALDLGKNLYSTNYIFLDADTGQVLSAKKQDEQISIASLTKMMTVLLAIENSSSLNQTVTITNEMIDGLYEEQASVAGYVNGDTATVLDLCYAAAIPSAADAANALAIQIGGSFENFYQMMNDKATQLGMDHTVFKSAHGLDREGQYSTVEDVSKLLRYALQNPTFKEIFSTKEHTTQATTYYPFGIPLASTIWAYADTYGYNLANLSGGKTGYTLQAGRCIAYWATVNDMNIIAVTAGASTNVEQYSNLSDAQTALTSLASWHKKTILKKNDVVSTIEYKSFMHTANIDVKMDKDITLDLPADVECTYEVDLPKKFSAELYDQNIQATITFTADNKTIYTKTISITLPQEKNIFGRIILHLQNFIKG